MLTHLHVNCIDYFVGSVGASILLVCFACLFEGLNEKEKTIEKSGECVAFVGTISNCF